ncbi:hypothetical protein [Labilibaculum sp.]|uniref:hypothetical protein n=1 Tax=Labilibaculum sp. TaxID=2060723 RepID=UPI002AA89F60|nr:hypothetical protein [Labilibaculum sp.]
MVRFKSIITILILIVAILGYSYKNYTNRAKGVNAVEQYKVKNNMTRIWHLKKVHFNIFDAIIEGKNQFNFILVDELGINKQTDPNYSLQFSFWKDPQNLETLSNFTLERHNDILRITFHDLFWIPTDIDSLSIKEATGTVFGRVDNWMSKKRNK